jgi:ABC-type lipoprotein release transport system permease subunit
MDRDFWDNQTLINSIEITDELDSLVLTDPDARITAREIVTGCLASTGYSTRGILVKGVEPDAEDLRSGLKNKIIEGEYLDTGNPGVVIGAKLASFLRVGAGDSLVILGQGYMGMTAAAELEITGLFQHPMEQVEKRIAFVHIETAEEVFFMNQRATTVSIVLNDYTDLEVSSARYMASLDTSRYEVKPWQEMNEVLLQQIESDNFFGKIIIGILYLVIGFGIFGTVLMMVMERRREFSVMMALGMRASKLVRIVLIETIMIGVIGAVIGLVLSFPVIYYFHMNPIPITGESADIYREFNMEPVLEVAIQPVSLVWQFAIVLLLSVGAAVFPVNSISRFNFVSIIRGRQ